MKVFIIFTLASLILGSLGYLEKIFKIKWGRKSLIILMMFFVLVSIGQAIVTIYNHSILKHNLQQKDQQLDSFVQKELLLRDFNIQLIYDFHFKNELSQDVKSSGNTGLVTNCALASSSSKDSLYSKQTLILYSENHWHYSYPNPNTLRVILTFSPEEKIVGKRIDYLTQFRVLAVPYKSLVDSLSEFKKFMLLQDTTLRIVISINGNIFENHEEKVSFPLDTWLIFFTKPKGIFNDIQSRYLKMLKIDIH